MSDKPASDKNKNSGKARMLGHPKYWLSGEQAKAFRRDLSLQAGGRSGGITLSHKFPLVVEPLHETARNYLREEYRLSSAVEENTLFHFFTAIHLAGFRLFPNVADAALHKMRQDTRKLNTQLKEYFPLEGNPAGELLSVLAKAPRANRSAEGVVKNIQRISQFKADEGTPLHDFVWEIANVIASGDKGKGLWGKNQKEDRWQAIVIAGEKLGWEFTLPQKMDYEYNVLWDGGADKYLHGADSSADGLEFAMHRLVSLAGHITGASLEKLEEAKELKETTRKIITFLATEAAGGGAEKANYSGLSWLFNPNRGVGMFAKEKSEVERDNFEIGRCSPEKLTAIRAIARSLCGAKYKFHVSRTLFGGGISSSVSNYLNRISELHQGLKGIDIANAPNIKDILTQHENADPQNAGLMAEYEQAALPVDELARLIGRLIKDKNTAKDALHRLMGGGESIAGEDEVQLIESFNDHYEEAKGLFIQLAEKLRVQAKGGKSDYATARKLFPSLEFLLPPKRKKGEEEEAEDNARYLKRKINRYSGAQVFNQRQIETALRGDYDKLKTLQQARARHWRHIADHYAVDIIAARTDAERQRIESSSKRGEKEHDFTALACRNILHRLAITVAKLGSRNALAAGMALFDRHSVFADKKEGAIFFAEGKGRLYVSPFADYQHQPLTLGAAFTADLPAATDKFIQAFFALAEDMQRQKTSADILRDAAILEQTTYALRCSSVREGVSSEHARPDDSCELNLPVSIQQALQRGSITAGELGRVFNAYASEINGLCARLSRGTIIAKSRLQHIGDNALHYAPKAAKDWRLPAHLFDAAGEVKGNSTLARGWRILQSKPTLFADEQTHGSGAKIQAGKLHEAILLLADCRKGDGGEEIFRDCLRQMPHDWHYKAGEYGHLLPLAEQHFPRPLDEKGRMTGVCTVKKEKKKATIGLAKKEAGNRYIRLSGTSCHKGWLDTILLGLGKGSIGDSSLIIEEEYRQRYDKDSDTFTIDYDKTRIDLAVVFKFSASTKDQEKELTIANRFIAIDLGERGIGYAVYNTPQSNGDALGAPIAQGHVIVPILRRLIKRVDTYRRRQQPRQRFQSNMNTALQQMREAAIGELAGVIDGLMKKHAAFPVFESSVSGFESGGKMLKMVYGSILQLYTYSGTDAHKAKRKDHWQASNTPEWKHPWLKQPGSDGKDLSMCPGVKVNPAGTSQTCSHDKHNPLALIDEIPAHSFPISSNEQGIITLPLAEDGDVQLYLYGGAETADKEKLNPLPAKKLLLKNHSFKNADELRKHVKDKLRHKPLAKASKDTTQSTYLSPFVLTQQALAGLSDAELKKQHRFRCNGLVFMHADVNAAVNIGAKWWRKINTPQEKKKPARKR